MELTIIFNELLKEQEPAAPSTGKDGFHPNEIDAFVKTAYSIKRDIASLHTELCSVRQAYLSTVAPRKTLLTRSKGRDGAALPPLCLTDADRNGIDKEAKDMLRELNARINLLASEESKRQVAAAAVINQKYGRGIGSAVASWAAGGLAGAGRSRRGPEHEAAVQGEEQIEAHRESILMFLRQGLGVVASLHKGMVETRLAREMEKNRSVLAKARRSELPPALAAELFGQSAEPASKPLSAAREAGGSGMPTSGVALAEEERQRRRGHEDPGLDLTDEQRQMFERDNQDMLKHYNSTLDKVKTAEKSILEVSELQSMLISNLTIQSAHIDQLVADSFKTEENVGGGNKQLKKASQRKFSQARCTFYAATGLCLFLVAWDLII